MVSLCLAYQATKHKIAAVIQAVIQATVGQSSSMGKFQKKKSLILRFTVVISNQVTYFMFFLPVIVDHESRGHYGGLLPWEKRAERRKARSVYAISIFYTDEGTGGGENSGAGMDAVKCLETRVWGVRH